MTIDIESLSLRELGALVVAAEQRKQLISSRRPASAVRRMLKAAAAEAGYTLEELFGGEASETPAPARKPTRRKSGKVAPKYRNPAKVKMHTTVGAPLTTMMMMPTMMHPLLCPGSEE